MTYSVFKDMQFQFKSAKGRITLNPSTIDVKVDHSSLSMKNKRLRDTGCIALLCELVSSKGGY